MDIQISDVKTLKNVRSELGDLGELMSSIKQHGILQPIGLWEEDGSYYVAFGNRRFAAVKKLGWTVLPEGSYKILKGQMSNSRFLVMNTIENVQRKDISPVELGKIANELKNEGLSVSEIASLISLPISKINTGLHLYSSLPSDVKPHIGYASGRLPKKGKIGATVAEKILNAHMSAARRKSLYEYARKEEPSGAKIDKMVVLMRKHDLDSALDAMEEIDIVSARFFLKKKEIEKLMKKYGVETKTQLLEAIIKSREPELIE